VQNNVKGGRFIFAPGFRHFGLWSLAPLLWACGEAEQNGGEGLVEKSCSLYDSQEAESETGRGQGQEVPFKGMSRL
jgi:hypothetical protein